MTKRKRKGGVMPRKPRSKRTDGSRNVPKRLDEMEERIDDVEKSVAVAVEEVAVDVVPDLVRAEMRRVIGMWQDDLERK